MKCSGVLWSVAAGMSTHHLHVLFLARLALSALANQPSENLAKASPLSLSLDPSSSTVAFAL
jgi:hypothetical protein